MSARIGEGGATGVFQPWRKFKPDVDGTPYGWIQWKGTNVCMDFYCACGTNTHIDEEFVYYLKCEACGQIYEMSGHVEARPVIAAEIESESVLKGASNIKLATEQPCELDLREPTASAGTVAVKLATVDENERCLVLQQPCAVVSEAACQCENCREWRTERGR